MMHEPTKDETGELIELEGDRVGVRFERRLAHPPERVWRAITAEDLKWFPARPEIAGERRVGATLQFTYPEGSEPRDGRDHRIRPAAPVRLHLAIVGPGVTAPLRARRRRRRGGSSSPRPPRGPSTAKVAAGWLLDDLETALAGEDPGAFPEGRWVELHESYAEQFGVSPESGRACATARKPSPTRAKH